MSRKLTKDELLKELFRDHYVPGQTKKLREVRVRVPGREMSLAHLIGVSQTEVYHNLGLHIGVHEGENHTGDSIGLMKFTPWELTVVAADIALKSGGVEIAFMDRFGGALILTGQRSEVRAALEGVSSFVRDVLHFTVCEITES